MKTRKPTDEIIAAGKPRRNSARAASGAAQRPVGFGEIRAAALRLPEVSVATSYGTPALKVRGKLLARLHQSNGSLVLRTDLLDREILLQSDPQVFFVTEHYRDHPWVLVNLAAVEPRELADLLERAWRIVAPKSLVIRYDSTLDPPVGG